MFDLSNPKKEEDNQRFRIPPPLFQTLPGPRINSLPKLTPAPAPMKFNMRPAHTMPKVQEQPDYKSAWIRGTLGSLAGRAVTPLVEKLSGRKIDLSTLPESNTFGEKAVGMIGNLGADLPLWLGGDALLAKPLSALAKYAPVAKGVNMLPEAITPALGTGVRAGATYGGPINLAETAMNRDGAEGFTNRLKEAPLMALGGSVLHGGGQLLGKGVKTGIDYKRFNTATKLPEIKSNPLQDLQNAYKNPVSLRNAKQQQLNKTFENTPNLIQSASTKTLQQGIDGATGVQKHLSGELLQQKKLDAQSAFGGPLKIFKVNKDLEGSIAEITAKMDKQVNDMAASIKQADGQTKILTIRQQVKDMGGISPSKGDLFEEQQVIPAWIKKDNGRPLDEVADELGMTSNELLFAISDSAYKKKDYVTEAYRMAYKDPEYQALSNTLDNLKGQSSVKKTLPSKNTSDKNSVNDPNPIPNAETGKPFKAILHRGEAKGRRDPARGTFYTQDKEYADIYANSGGIGGKASNVVTSNVVSNNPLVSLSKRTLLEELAAQGDATATTLLKAKDIDFGNAVVERYIAKKARSLGHDSIVLKNMMEVVQLDIPLNNKLLLPQTSKTKSITLKPREIKPITIEPPLQPRTLPEKPKPLQWTNKDNLGQAGPLPIRSINEGDLGKLPGRVQTPLRPAVTANNLGHSQIVPSMPMRLQRFNDAIPDLPNTASHIVSKTERQPTNLETLKTNAYIKTTDNLHRLNQLDQYVEKSTGTKLSPKDKTYMLGLNSRGTGMTSSTILEEALVNPQGVKIGDSLKTNTKQLKSAKDMQSFDDYLVNKHAITRMRAGEKVYPDEMAMTPEMSEAKVKEIEALHPEFKELSTKLYEFQNKLTKSWLVDTGIVSPEAYGKWVIDNPHYVPNNRFFSELEKPGFGVPTKRGFAGQSNPVKARTTSQRKVISPLETIMEHTEQYVKVARRNEVMQSLIRNLEKNPEEFKGWAEIIPSDSQLKEGLMGEINKILEADGMDGVVEAFNKQFDDIFSAKKQSLDMGNIVTGLVGGEKVHVRVNDPLLLDALTNLKPQAQKNVIAALGSVTRVMKNLTTGINPVFGLARNIWRDIPTAFINSKSTNNPLVFGKDLLGSIIDIMGNKEVYKSYKAMGGGYASSSVSASRNTLAESKARLLPSTLNVKRPLQTTKELVTHPLKSTKKILSTGMGTLERFNNVVESAPRLGEFKRVSKAGDYDAKIKGLYEANDVTTNFSRSGNIIKDADAVFPYLNAAWQGIDKLVRTFKNNPVQAPIKAMAAVTFPTIVLYQLNHNNPAYQQLSDYNKDNYFLFPKSDGTFIKIPKPREVGVMFGSSVERALRQFEDHDSDAFNRFMETVKTNFTPPLTRSILAPLSDVRANENFIGAPIVTGAVSRLSPPLQFDERTSEPAKFLGKKLNQSPQQIDYLARSYLGGVAQLGIPATTKNGSVGKTLNKQVTADPVFSNDIQRDFYKTLDKISTSSADAKATGDSSLEKGQYYKSMFNKTNTYMGKLRKEVDKIQAGTLTNEEKDAKIRVLQIRMLEMAKEANSKFKLK